MFVDIVLLYRCKYFYFPLLLIIINLIALVFFEKDIKYYSVLIIYFMIPVSVIVNQRLIDLKDDKISGEIFNLSAPLILDALEKVDIKISRKIILVVAKKRKNIVDGEIVVKLPDKTPQLEKIKDNLQREIHEKINSNIKLIFDYRFSPGKKKSENRYGLVY